MFLIKFTHIQDDHLDSLDSWMAQQASPCKIYLAALTCVANQISGLARTELPLIQDGRPNKNLVNPLVGILTDENGRDMWFNTCLATIFGHRLVRLNHQEYKLLKAIAR